MTMSSILRSTANRAVHLTITPRPSNVGESREVLRLLSQFGEVEYFRNLKYDALSVPNAAIAIFQSTAAADSCLRKSPIRFRMGRAMKDEDPDERHIEGRVGHPDQAEETAANEEEPESSPNYPNTASGSPFGLGQRRPMSTTTAARAPTEPLQPPEYHSSEPVRGARIFQIQSRRARMKFRDQINVGHYYGNFSIDSKSIVQKALAKSVPILGLSCVNWRAEQKPWRLVQQETKASRDGLGRRKTLRELYEEGPTGRDP